MRGSQGTNGTHTNFMEEKEFGIYEMPENSSGNEEGSAPPTLMDKLFRHDLQDGQDILVYK